jgi:predicted transcriptional regulator
MPEGPPFALLDRELTSTIVAAYVRCNQVAADQLATLISTVHQALVGLGNPVAEVTVERTPAVPIRRSVHHDYVVCLECGWRGQMLRRHLTTSHGLSIDQHRARWNLSSEHPITAQLFGTPIWSRSWSAFPREGGGGRTRNPANTASIADDSDLTRVHYSGQRRLYHS